MMSSVAIFVVFSMCNALENSSYSGFRWRTVLSSAPRISGFCIGGLRVL